MNWSDQIRELNDLHELLADGRKGYHEAAEKVDRPQLAEFLERLSMQRETMQGELAAEIRRFRPDDKMKDGTAKGVLHQAWMDIRAALGSSDDTSMLDECERGERYLLQRYDEILTNSHIEPDSKPLLEIQRGQIKDNLSMVRTLRQSKEESLEG